MKNPAGRSLLTLLTAALLAVTPGCGDETETPSGAARVGESCASNTDCTAGLLCNGLELRCVRLCALGSDECGEGIACEPADDGAVGFCPLPPL